MSEKRRKIIFFTSVLVTASVLTILFSTIEFSAIAAAFLKSNKILLMSAILLFFCIPFICARRWQKLLELLSYDLPYKKCLCLYLASIPLSKISPANLGDLSKAYYLKEEIPVSKNAGAILAESFLDVLVLLILVLVGSLISKMKSFLFIDLAGLFFVLLFFIFVAKFRLNRAKNWQGRLENFFDIFKKLAGRPLYFLSVMFYSFLIWLSGLIFVKICFVSLGGSVPTSSLVIFQPMVALISLLPVTISGIGVRETSMLYFYSNFSAAPIILSVGLLYSLISGVILPALCLPFMWRALKNKAKITKNL